MMDDFIVTMNDVVNAGYCVKGARRWFKDHGFDDRDVIRNGASAQAMLDTNDGLGIDVVNKTKLSRAQNG